MKKGLGVLFLILLVAGFASAIEYGEIIAKVDTDNSAVFHVLDVDTEERIGILKVTDYGTGVISAEMNTPETEVSIRIFLLDKETKQELRTWTKGPFDTSQDLTLDLREGIYKELDIEEPETTTEEETTETNEEPETTTTETETAETTEEETIETGTGITGNAVGEGENTRLLTPTLAFIIILGLIIALFIHIKKKHLIQKMPEEKELQAMQKQVKTEKKALSKIKTEQKIKRKIEAEKRKTAVKLAKEDAELGQLNKDGSAQRAREAERYDKKSGTMY